MPHYSSKCSIAPENFDRPQDATQGITPPAFSTPHPSQAALLEFLSSFNQQALLPSHFQGLSSSILTYLKSYLSSYSDHDGALPRSLLNRRFISPKEKIAPEALAKELLALDPNIMNVTLNTHLLHPTIDMSFFEHFQEDPDLPISHARL